MKADLHTHTVLSDGALDVEQLFHHAKHIGLDYLSVTDHNSTHSIAPAMALGKELDIQVIPGVELSTYHSETGTKPHILCYFPVDIKRLQKKLDKYIQLEKEAKLSMYTKLMEDYPITLEQLEEVAKYSTSIYKVHMMQVLASLGYTGQPIGELHDKLFGAGSKYNCPQEYISTKDAAALIHTCGGVAVLAHPGQYKNPMLMEMLIEHNYLDGLEYEHPRNDEQIKEHILSLSKEHDLFLTGGTDFHGLYSTTPYPLGTYLCPEEGLERLQAAGKEANMAYFGNKEKAGNQ
ncbi:MAG: PHP domain-containing protein [Anaerostipes sp.]|nr:PHP domain-containing protein [Anaerostipes sp.]